MSKVLILEKYLADYAIRYCLCIRVLAQVRYAPVRVCVELEFRLDEPVDLLRFCASVQHEVFM